MPKLLSKEEVFDIAAKMTAEYGLAPLNILNNNYNKSYDSGLRAEIGRTIKEPTWFPWYKKVHFVKISDFYAENFEDVLIKLRNELSKFDGRAKIAEQFREKYALQEADIALDKILQNKTS